MGQCEDGDDESAHGGGRGDVRIGVDHVASKGKAKDDIPDVRIVEEGSHEGEGSHEEKAVGDGDLDNRDTNV